MAGISSPDRSSAPSTELAARWSQRHDPRHRAVLVDSFTGLVRRLAARCYAKRIGNELQFGDFVQFGMVGLLEALDRFNPALGVRFETFAAYRIEGAIWNGVQTLSELQQQVAARRGLLGDRSASLAQASEGGEASALERLANVAIGLALGFALEDSGLYQDDEAAAPDNAYSRLELAQLNQHIAALVDKLPDQERLVIFRHYFQQVRFDEIALTLGVTKGRVSQIHHAGLRRLREMHGEKRFLAEG